VNRGPVGILAVDVLEIDPDCVFVKCRGSSGRRRKVGTPGENVHSSKYSENVSRGARGLRAALPPPLMIGSSFDEGKDFEDAFVNCILIDETLVDGFDESRASMHRWAGHFEVQACVDRGSRRIRPAPIRHDQSVKPPFSRIKQGSPKRVFR